MAGRALIALASVFGVLATWTAHAGAQQLEPCDAPWLDVDHVQAILQVELGDDWDASLDAIVVRFEECATDQPRVVLTSPEAEPTTLTLRLARVGIRARGRLVALVIAELLRTRVSSEPEAVEDVTEELAVETATTAAAPPVAAVDPVVPPLEPVPASTSALVSAPAPAPVITPASEPASQLAPASSLAPAPVSSPASASPSPWRLGATAGFRFYFEHATPAALVDVTLRYDRLLLAIAGAGGQLDAHVGVVRLAQLTLGVGARLVEHRGTVRVGWDIRGDVGAALAAGEITNPGFVSGEIAATTTYTWVLGASTQLEVVWPIGSIELGLTTDVGYQRGIVERNDFGDASLAGVFATLGASLAWAL